MTEHYPLTVNDPDRTARVAAALRGHFGEDRVHELAAPVSASEDFGSFGTEWGVPSVFWYVGGTDPERLPQGRAGRPRRPGHPDQPQREVRSRSSTPRSRPASRPSRPPHSTRSPVSANMTAVPSSHGEHERVARRVAHHRAGGRP